MSAASTAALLSALHLGLGAETNVDGAMQVERGLVARVELQAVPWLSVGLDGAWRPRRSTMRLEYAYLRDLDDLLATEDFSPVKHRSQLTTRLTPFRGQTGGWHASLSLTLGGGLVHTVDDADVLGWDDQDPAYAEVGSQWHLAPALGIEEAFGRGPVALHLGAEWLTWTEQLPGGTSTERSVVMGRAMVVVTPGRSKS